MANYDSFKSYLEKNYKGPYVATDLIIRHDTGEKQGIVLIERKYPPLGISTVGGLAERMSFDKNAVKEGKEESGLDCVLDDPKKPLCVLSEVEQDPRAFIASITFTAIGKGKLSPDPKEDAKSAAVYTLKEVSDLLRQPKRWAFEHHREILQIYMKEVERDPRLLVYS